ncbi:hypothetical protein [Companilactobacillus farciminis]|uniref:hypothetical protein n=1 Tax=Companilactobacillus farciminis TaxID=1612 RepID=UPI00241F2F75|nr:hypothetical protein [Companilactobacillus farciminis]
MSKKFKFKLNHAGVGQLLKSSEMVDVLEEKATEIRNGAGDGYAQDTYIGKNRANAMVYADTYQAKKDNYKNNTLLKAVQK